MPKKIREFSQDQINNINEFEGIENNLKDLFVKFNEDLDHLVFSDTIVFTLPLPYKNSQLAIDHQSFMFALYYMAVCSAYLVERMHANGLPVRGVIHEGEYFKKEQCLAGIGIVEAYQSCEAINLSGLVCSKKLSDKLVRMSKKRGQINNNSDIVHLFTYQTPYRDGNEVQLVHVNWIGVILTIEENKQQFIECRNDIENYVWKSFWAHQKDCPSTVDLKVHNTIKLLRKMIYIIDATIAKKAKKNNV